MLLLPAELPSDEARNADTSVNNKRKAILHRYLMCGRLSRGHPLGNAAFAGRTPLSARDPHHLPVVSDYSQHLEVPL